jgi:hypothetical protein
MHQFNDELQLTRLEVEVAFEYMNWSLINLDYGLSAMILKVEVELNT